MRRERGLLALVAVVVLHLGLFRGGVPIHLMVNGEGGAWVDEAVRVLDGEVMYRDFFEFLPPGIVYLNATVLAVFGRRIAAITWAAVALGLLLTLLLHAVAARVAGPRWRLLPPALLLCLLYPFYSVGNHKWPALACGLGGLWILTARAPSAASAVAAGAAFAGAVLFTPDLGLGMSLGALLHVIARGRAGRSHALWMAAAWLGVGAVVMAAMTAAAGLSAVVNDCIVFPLTHYRLRNPPKLMLFQRFLSSGPRNLAFHTIGLLSPLAAVMLLRRGAPDPVRAAAAVGLGLLIGGLARPLSGTTLALRCVVLMVVLACALEWLAARGGLARTASLSVATLLAVTGTVTLAASLARRQWLDPLWRHQLRAGEVWLTASYAELPWIESRTAAGEPAVLLPSEGGMYFLTGTRNITPLPYLQAGMSPPEHVEAVLRAVERARPKVGYWRGDANLGYAELLRWYEPVMGFGGSPVGLQLKETAAGAAR